MAGHKNPGEILNTAQRRPDGQPLGITGHKKPAQGAGFLNRIAALRQTLQITLRQLSR